MCKFKLEFDCWRSISVRSRALPIRQRSPKRRKIDIFHLSLLHPWIHATFAWAREEICYVHAPALSWPTRSVPHGGRCTMLEEKRRASAGRIILQLFPPAYPFGQNHFSNTTRFCKSPLSDWRCTLMTAMAMPPHPPQDIATEHSTPDSSLGPSSASCSAALPGTRRAVGPAKQDLGLTTTDSPPGTDSLSDLMVAFMRISFNGKSHKVMDV